MRGIWMLILVVVFFASWGFAAGDDARAAARKDNDDASTTRPAQHPIKDAELDECVNALSSLTAQVELYKFMHGGKYPTANGKPDGAQWQWELLTGLTTADDGKRVGPFLLAPVINPLSRSSTVVSKPEKGAGWLLDGKGRLLGLDQGGQVIGLPQPAPRAAILSSARSSLQTLRSVVELYRLQHGNSYPTTSGKPIAAEWSWALLTGKSADSAGRKVGPYLVSVPENALTGSSRVVAKPEKGAGWVLTPEGQLNAVRENGEILGDGNP